MFHVSQLRAVQKLPLLLLAFGLLFFFRFPRARAQPWMTPRPEMTWVKSQPLHVWEQRCDAWTYPEFVQGDNAPRFMQADCVNGSFWIFCDNYNLSIYSGTDYRDCTSLAFCLDNETCRATLNKTHVEQPFDENTSTYCYRYRCFEQPPFVRPRGDGSANKPWGASLLLLLLLLAAGAVFVSHTE